MNHSALNKSKPTVKKIIFYLLPLFLFLVFHQANCTGFDNSGDIKGSCHFYEPENKGYCNEYVGDSYNAADIEFLCSGKGTYSLGECSTRRNQPFGACIMEKDTIREYHVIIDRDDATIATESAARTYCQSTLGGYWLLL